MLATIAFAFLASAAPDPLARLGVATPRDAAAAVASCLKAVTPGAVDDSRLIAEGWRRRASGSQHVRYFTRPQNASVLITTDGPMSDICLVRVRLADAESIDGVGAEIDSSLGVNGQRRPGQPGYFYWRKGRQLVGSESFDDGPGSQPHVIQIAVGEWPKEFR